MDDGAGVSGEWAQWKVAIERATRCGAPSVPGRVDANGDSGEDYVAKNLLATLEQLVGKKHRPGPASRDGLSLYVLKSIYNRSRRYGLNRAAAKARLDVVSLTDEQSGEVVDVADGRDLERQIFSKRAVVRLAQDLSAEEFVLLTRFAERGRILDAYDPKFGSESSFRRHMGRLIARARQIVEGNLRC